MSISKCEMFLGQDAASLSQPHCHYSHRVQGIGNGSWLLCSYTLAELGKSLCIGFLISDHPERAALLFVSSVCVGLILTLCALVIRVSCFKDFQKLQGKKEHLVPESDGVDESSENEEEEDEDSSGSELPDELAELYRPSYSGYNSAEAADLAERIERREQIMQEIWMNSGLDMTPPRNMNTFYINEE